MYEFKEQDAFEFARHVGIEAKVRSGQLHFKTCPYCKPKATKDNMNTFAIDLKTGQFKCLRSSCGIHGNMITLSRDFDFSISEEIDRYYNRDDYNAKFKKFRQAHIEVRDNAIQYMASRGISEAVVRKYRITTQSGKENILCFPFFNQDNELKFIKYRNLDYIKGQGAKEWCEANCMPILFGMDQCNLENKQLVITEGQIDSLSVAEAGIENAVSVPTGCNGFTWVPHCWDWLENFTSIIVFGDCEKGKITLVDELLKRFPNKIKVVREQDYQGCKDANEILQKHGPEGIRNAVHNAIAPPTKQIKRLADVEAVDILNTETIKTDIAEIDKLLSGGMHVGQLILLTGKRGDGKSTFMSQLIANATEQGYASFVYSGELVDFYFKRWIDMQFVGRGQLSNNTISELNRWYYDKIFLYDNSVVDDELEDLLSIVEKAICKYDCKFICIDNLMTAIDVDVNTDLYRAQSKFVGQLAKIAKTYNVVVLLVAHPRKTREGFTNDDVSGSADITNKVDIVMSYCRINSEDENERQLKVTKNRLTGKLTSERNDIRLFYSADSKRIVGADMDFGRIYSFRKNEDGFIPVPEDAEYEIPFD